ncbi:GTP-binding protein [Natronolimnohabitans sp. A-GB9]|uniref:CobW family GTP-binding protein n=1 Tax=Natronolimnohabitans sp. A-GB9 TaxID=3069757 RepID=UPI0027B1BE87|nr:GTP-binding protein [Natronolimnohabitans sp. A-GB9]MDQ2052335.1 GTP-binding protein [Natronolimnohabitans sp. A-GB9]
MSVPVTVLCGELGAGKTTLLSGLLESTDREIAVLVNDVGAVNVDADLVEARTDLQTGEEVLALENGCICCSLGGELSRSVIQLWKEHDFEYLVVEASGVGEPEPIARQFVRGPASGPYDLDAVVTVVDARRFYDRFVDDRTDLDEPPVQQGPDETGTRPLADLLLEQIEFCDLLVVNKCDLVDEAERDRVVAVLETLQPRAEVHTTEYGTLEPDAILDSDRFDLEAATESAGWKRAIEADDAGVDGHDHDGGEHDHAYDHDHDHAHPPERYGIEVDTYHRRRPFHPERFASLLADLPDGLVRAKGLCWVAGRERQAITMSYAGTETTLEVTGRWIASFSEKRQQQYREGQPDLSWDEEWGDRETRLALIGRDLSMDALQARLDDCLLTDAEMDTDWSTFENPAPTGMGETVTVTVSSDDRS